jgi:hypothetical protein
MCNGAYSYSDFMAGAAWGQYGVLQSAWLTYLIDNDYHYQ